MYEYIWSRHLISFVDFHTGSKTIWVISTLCLNISILVFWICSTKFSFCSTYFMVVWMMLCHYYEQFQWLLLYHCYEIVAEIALLFIFMLIRRKYECISLLCMCKCCYTTVMNCSRKLHFLSFYFHAGPKNIWVYVLMYKCCYVSVIKL